MLRMTVEAVVCCSSVKYYGVAEMVDRFEVGRFV